MIGKFIAKKIGISAIRNIMEKRSIKKIQDHEQRIKVLEEYSHPPQEFICCRKCGCKISKTKKRRK